METGEWRIAILTRADNCPWRQGQYLLFVCPEYWGQGHSRLNLVNIFGGGRRLVLSPCAVWPWASSSFPVAPQFPWVRNEERAWIRSAVLNLL